MVLYEHYSRYITISIGFFFHLDRKKVTELISQNGTNINDEDGDVDKLLIHAAKDGKMKRK